MPCWQLVRSDNYRAQKHKGNLLLVLGMDVVAAPALNETAHFKHDDLDPACLALRTERHDRRSTRCMPLSNLSDHGLVRLRDGLVSGPVHGPVRSHHDRAPLGLGIWDHRGQVPEGRRVAHVWLDRKSYDFVTRSLVGREGVAPSCFRVGV